MTEKLIDVTAGRSLGHEPGHHYYDAWVRVVERKRGGYLATAGFVWGAAQGYDEEHGSHETSVRGDTLEDVLSALRPEAMALANDCGDEVESIERRAYMRSALSQAEHELDKIATIDHDAES
jgi:hypothetical protein